MARPLSSLLLPLLLLLPPLLLVLPLAFPPPPPANAPAVSEPGCPPGWFRCEPGAPCFHREWLCDGHPDCEDGRDESGCGTATPTPAGAAWETPPWRSASAAPVPEGSEPLRSEGSLWILVIAAEPPPHVLTRCCQRFSACALSSLVLLSILVAVASIAERALSKAKNRSDIFSLENASREQLMPAKGQTGSFL